MMLNNKRLCIIQMPSEDPLLGSIGTKLPPLSLGILAGYLRSHGLEVDLVDLIPRVTEIFSQEDINDFQQFYEKEIVYQYVKGIENKYFDNFVLRMLEEIPMEDYDIIGISVGPHLSWVQTFCGLIFGAYIKNNYKKKLIFGGFNLTTMANYQPTYDELFYLINKELGYIILGPGEKVLYELVNEIRGEEDQDLIHKLEGICYINSKDKLKCNPSANRLIVMPNFDGLKLSDYYNYIKKDAYEETMVALFRYPFAFTKKLITPKQGEYEPYLIIPYIFNYNCPYNCSFCVESDPDSPKPVIGTVEQVIADIKRLKEKYHTPYFYFINNAINLSKKFVREFCEAFQKENITIYWSDCARFDHTDMDLLKLMYDSGCRKLVFGMESGSKEMVKRINKKIDLEYASQILEWCSEIGIWAELEIIFGMPTENEEYFNESYEYIKKNLHNISFFTTNHYIPMPGSVMFRTPQEFGIEITQKANFEEILHIDLELLKNGKNPVNYNNPMKLYHYKEIHGRSASQIHTDTLERIKKAQKLLNGKLIQEMVKYMGMGYISMNDLQVIGLK